MQTNDMNSIAGREGVGFLTAVESMIKRSCIIDYGIIQKVTSKGIVEVSLAVAKTQQDMVIMTCVLANIASSSFTLDVKPNVGDRVLVVYPRLYDETMFTVPDNDTEKTNVIVNKNAKGYNLTTGIAILINQCKTASHKNIIRVEDGAVTLALGYDKQNDKNHLTVTAGADGAVEVKNDATDLQLGADGAITANVSYDSDSSEYKATATIGADGYLSYTHKKDAMTALTFTSSGMTLQDKNGCNIESDNSGVTINGKLFIKA